MEYLPSYTDSLYLVHHGIKGQKWGVRRYQNEDGSLTPAGKKRQARAEYRSAKAKASDTYHKKSAEDDIQIYADSRRGKITSTEADRRTDNKQNLRYQQYKQHQLAAKSEMSKKLAENSKGIVKDFHNVRAAMQENASKRYGRSADATKKMIADTNKIHDSMSRGERMVARLFSDSTDSLNAYYMDRKKRSAASVIGERAAMSTIDIAADVYVQRLMNKRNNQKNTES